MFIEKEISAKTAEDIVTGITMIQNAELDIKDERGQVKEIIALPPKTAKALVQQKQKLKQVVTDYQELTKELGERANKDSKIKGANFDEIGEQYNAAMRAAREELYKVEILESKISLGDFGKVNVKSYALELLEDIIE